MSSKGLATENLDKFLKCSGFSAALTDHPDEAEALYHTTLNVAKGLVIGKLVISNTTFALTDHLDEAEALYRTTLDVRKGI